MAVAPIHYRLEVPEEDVTIRHVLSALRQTMAGHLRLGPGAIGALAVLSAGGNCREMWLWRPCFLWRTACRQEWSHLYHMEIPLHGGRGGENRSQHHLFRRSANYSCWQVPEKVEAGRIAAVVECAQRGHEPSGATPRASSICGQLHRPSAAGVHGSTRNHRSGLIEVPR